MAFKKKSLHFEGRKEIDTKERNRLENVISMRYKGLIICVFAVALIFIARLFYIQIKNQDHYNNKLIQYSNSVFNTETYRGSIYDRNYDKLVYNQNVNCATYYAVKGIKTDEIKIMVSYLVKNVEIDISDVTEREKKDYLIMKDSLENESKYIDSLTTAQEKKDNESSDLDKLILQRITEDILKEKLSDEDIKYYKIYYKIKSCRSGSTVLLEGLSIKEASLIGENSSLLRGIKVTNDWQRQYLKGSDFKQVFGRVTTKKEGLPATYQELLLASGYNNDSRVGVSGLESQYENILNGSDALYSISYDADGNPIVDNVSTGTKGQNIRLTIDWELQELVSQEIEKELKKHTGYAERYNNHIFVTLMDPNTGDIIVMAGKQRDPKTGKIIDYAAGNYLNSYEIGSTFKAATIYTSFKEGILEENTYIQDTPVKIAGTKAKKSWKSYGNVNEVQALAYSSNVYMFHMAMKLGGANYQYDQPLKINKEAFDVLRKDAGDLGLGVKTGLDVPNEALGYRGRAKQGGNLLDFAIGQYDTYTTMQMAQYVSTVANGGKRVQPHLFLDAFEETEDGTNTTFSHKVTILDDVSENTLAFKRIREGFRGCIVYGTGKSVEGNYQAAGKTGTAEKFDYATNVDYPNHAFVGYAPYDDPQIAVACMAERQKAGESCKPLSKYAFTKYFEKYGVKSE